VPQSEIFVLDKRHLPASRLAPAPTKHDETLMSAARLLLRRIDTPQAVVERAHSDMMWAGLLNLLADGLHPA
jgi:hypothetical protein